MAEPGGKNARGASPEWWNLSDEEVMLEVQQGNGDAFAALFDRYHRLVLVTALKIVRDVGEAEEVTQNVFFEIYRSAGKFDPARGSLRVWLLQYAYHRSINRRNYLLLRLFYDRADLTESSGWSPATRMPLQLAGLELAHLVDEALESLTEAQSQAIRWVVYEGLTLKEVAERARMPLSTVRNHYYRGLDRLRDYVLSRPATEPDRAVSPFGEVSRAEA